MGLKRIYVSLDELLDTRLGLIQTIKPELVERYLGDDIARYTLRMHDSVIWNDLGLDEVGWYSLWEQRGYFDVLPNSVVTRIPALINSILKEYQASNEHAIGDWDIRLDINLHPYPFTDEEQTMLETILSELMPGVTQMNFIRKGVKQLTPKDIKARYDYIIMYSFQYWSMIHAEELKNLLMPQCHFFVPRLFVQIPPDELFEKDKVLKHVVELDPFKLMESAISYKLGLRHIAASDFAPKFIPPLQKSDEITDLDSLLDQSAAYIPDSSQSDPLSPFLQGLTPVLVTEKHQA